jgi:hypothetical protein
MFRYLQPGVLEEKDNNTNSGAWRQLYRFTANEHIREVRYVDRITDSGRAQLQVP